MRAPVFWTNPPDRPGWQARILAPLGWLYNRATAKRLLRRPDFTAQVPVICIGNLHAGGTGKTPAVIALAQHLQTQNFAVHVVSRGYGGSLNGPVRVEERHHNARQTGDEPLLLAAFAPTWVAKDRAAGVEAAQAAGAEIILLDDGFQNPSVSKDLSIVVVDAHLGFGNGKCLPAGPLRESISQGLARADILLSIGDHSAQQRFKQLWKQQIPKDLCQIQAVLEPLETGLVWRGLRLLAFAGIGHPEKFFATLKSLGAELIQTEALSDHQPLTPALLARLERDAKAVKAQLATTEKDAVRLPKEFRSKVLTLPVRLALDDWQPLDKRIQELLKSRPASGKV